MPALACVPPPAHHACCEGMAESCSSPAMSHQSCCQVHSPDSTIPLVRTSTPEYPLTLAGPTADMCDHQTLNAGSLQMVAATPPASPPGDNSILRI
jgi:hypothetical protein